MLYWLGIGFELLSACLVAEVCQASNVFLIRKEPLSMNCLQTVLMTAGPGVTKYNASKAEKRSWKVSYFVPRKQILRDLEQILQYK